MSIKWNMFNEIDEYTNFTTFVKSINKKPLWKEVLSEPSESIDFDDDKISFY